MLKLPKDEGKRNKVSFFAYKKEVELVLVNVSFETTFLGWKHETSLD